MKSDFYKRKREYFEYIKSDKWKRKREQLFRLRGRKCEECNSKKLIHVHHKTYKNFKNEKMEDLQVLCKSCHRKKHPKKKR